MARVSRFDRTPPKKEGPRTNRDIRVPRVRLIGAEGENLGVVQTREALELAQSASLDLVEISPQADPPVCKILDYGRFKFQQQKKAAEARKNQKIIETKEIKMRPMIDDHDYDTKMRSVTRFLEQGNKVKFTIRFRGREMAHQDKGLEVLERVREGLGDSIKVDLMPKIEGRAMTMLVSPKG